MGLCARGVYMGKGRKLKNATQLSKIISPYFIDNTNEQTELFAHLCFRKEPKETDRAFVFLKVALIVPDS